MSAVTCGEVRELAPELALGIVSGPERAEALQHASECGPCRALVGELAEAADALTLLAAEAEPPPGFEGRVLAALRAGRRGSRRRLVAAGAAIAAAAAIVSIVGVRVVESTQESRQSAVAATDMRKAQMVGANGVNVGNVFVSDGRPATVVVNVNYGVPSGTYDIQFRSGSQTTRLGTMSITDEHGSWGGVGKLPNGANGSVALVDGNGTPVCEAHVS
jgi:hypothetical protein